VLTGEATAKFSEGLGISTPTTLAYKVRANTAIAHLGVQSDTFDDDPKMPAIKHGSAAGTALGVSMLLWVHGDYSL